MSDQVSGYASGVAAGARWAMGRGIEMEKGYVKVEERVVEEEEELVG